MLLLTRRQGETIMIGDGIRIKVLNVSEAFGEVRIEVDAEELVTVGSTGPEANETAPKVAVITHKRKWRSLLSK